MRTSGRRRGGVPSAGALLAGEPRVVLVMGVAGSGKTTIGQRVASRLGARFIEADEHHPPHNIARMRGGFALTDAERTPWLHRLRDEIDRSVAAGEDVVLACSALKRVHRRILLGGPPLGAETIVIHLVAEPAVLERRLATRKGHFFGPELLDSQLSALEAPPGALTLDAVAPPDELVERILERTGRPEAPPDPGTTNWRAQLRRELLAMPGVSEGASRFDEAAAFHAGGQEIAHFHSDDTIDVRVSRALQRSLKTDPRVTFRARPSDWIEVQFFARRDLDLVVGLVRETLAGTEAGDAPATRTAGKGRRGRRS